MGMSRWVACVCTYEKLLFTKEQIFGILIVASHKHTSVLNLLRTMNKLIVIFLNETVLNFY